MLLQFGITDKDLDLMVCGDVANTNIYDPNDKKSHSDCQKMYEEQVAWAKEAGVDFRSAYKSALSGILVSRSFFNLEEGSPNENRSRLNDFELASRLSYFLWSSMPDEQLFTAEEEVELGQEWFRITMPRGELACDGFHQMSARG